MDKTKETQNWMRRTLIIREAMLNTSNEILTFDEAVARAKQCSKEYLIIELALSPEGIWVARYMES